MFVRAYACVPVQSGVPRGTAALGQACAPLPVEDAKQAEARTRRDLPVGLLKVSAVADTPLVGPEGLSVQGLPALPDHLGRRASPGCLPCSRWPVPQFSGSPHRSIPGRSVVRCAAPGPELDEHDEQAVPVRNRESPPIALELCPRSTALPAVPATPKPRRVGVTMAQAHAAEIVTSLGPTEPPWKA